MAEVLEYQRWAETDDATWRIRRSGRKVEITHVGTGVLLWRHAGGRASRAWWALAAVLVAGVIVMVGIAAFPWGLSRGAQQSAGLWGFACLALLAVEVRAFYWARWRMRFEAMHPDFRGFTVGLVWWGRACRVLGQGPGGRGERIARIGRRQLHLTFLPEYEWTLTTGGGVELTMRLEKPGGPMGGRVHVLRSQGVALASARTKDNVVMIALGDGSPAGADLRGMAALFVMLCCPEVFNS